MGYDVYKLTLITNKKTTPINTYIDTILPCVTAGVTALQLREKNLPYQELLYFGHRLKEILAPYNIPLIVNDNVRLALELKADGVHLGQEDDDVLITRDKIGPDKLLGLSINTFTELQHASHLPINYVGIGAIFNSINKPEVKTIWGIHGLKQIAPYSRHPIIAIGGINLFNAASVMRAGAYGIAAIDAFHRTKNPQQTTQALRKIIDTQGTTHATTNKGSH